MGIRDMIKLKGNDVCRGPGFKKLRADCRFAIWDVTIMGRTMPDGNLKS